MGVRGRASAADPAVIGPSGIETIRRPEPPTESIDEQAIEWCVVVNLVLLRRPRLVSALAPGVLFGRIDLHLWRIAPNLQIPRERFGPASPASSKYGSQLWAPLAGHPRRRPPLSNSFARSRRVVVWPWSLRLGFVTCAPSHPAQSV